MRKGALLFIIFLLPVLLAAYPSQEEISLIDYETLRADSAHGFDVEKYELYLEINDSSHYIEGTVNAIVTATEEIDEISYNLIGMTVDEVFVNEETAAYEHSGGFLTIELGNMSIGEQFTTAVSYHGYPQSSPGYGGGVFWNSNYVFTVSDPDASRYWWPCYDHPWDKAIADIHITIRDDWLVAANGIRSGIDDNGNGTHTTHWLGENPMTTYLVCFHASNFVEFEQSAMLPSGNELYIQHFCPPNQLSNAEEDFADMPWMIEYFSDIFGEYPFEKFGNCVVPMTIFAGMEHQTMVTLANYLVTGQGTYETVFAHELAHQWYGDCVAFLDFPHVWLSEGFATYSEALWMEEKYGFEAMVDYIESDIQGYYINWAGSVNHTIFNPSFYNYFTPPVYEKAASVLHMLRLQAGDDNFFTILQDYFSTYMHGNAVTSEFRAIVEDVTGEDYEQFFEQWIFGSGIPSYEYTWFFNPNMAIPRIRTLVKTNSSSDTDFYTSVPFRLCFASGNSDSILVEATPAGAYTELMLDDFIIEDVEFDTNSWLLERGVSYHRVEIAGVNPFAGGAVVYWLPFWEETVEAAGYNVYRAEDENGEYILLNGEPVDGTSYEDNGLEIGGTYYYKIEAVLEESWFSERSEAVEVEVISFPFDLGVLLIDETADGSGNPGSPSDEQVDDFYAEIFGDNLTFYDFSESGAPDIELMRHYSTIIWHDDDISQKNFADCETDLTSYVYAGGNLLISGWKTADDMSEMFLQQFAGSNEYGMASGYEFSGALSQQYNDIMIDGSKLPAAFNGNLPYVTIFPEADASLFSYEGIPGSSYQDMPVAVRSNTAGNCLILGFPLYFCQQTDAANFGSAILEEYGETAAEDFTLEDNPLQLNIYPNPCLAGNRNGISLEYNINGCSSCTATLYNIRGQKLAERELDTSSRSLNWNFARNYAAGVYYVKLKAGNQSAFSKLLLLK